jgi:hypothetical protein
MSGAVTFFDPVDGNEVILIRRVGENYVGVTIGAVRVLFRGDSLDESVDLAETVLRKALEAIHESWPQ